MRKIFLLLCLILAACRTIPPRGEGYMETGGASLYYEVSGSGPLLVLVHDGLLSSEVWREQIKEFNRHFTVIRYDRRGYGKSGPGRDAFQDHEDLALLFDHLGIERAHLAGISGGGEVVLDFALAYPERTRKIVLLGGVISGYTYSKEFDRRNFYNFEPMMKGEKEKSVERWLADPFLIPRAAEDKIFYDKMKLLFMEQFDHLQGVILASMLKAPPKEPALGRLAAIQSPALIIIGEKDIEDVKTMGALMDKEISVSRLEIIPGAGHLVNLEQPEVFNRITLEFLQEK